jgi:hypothetical protein
MNKDWKEELDEVNKAEGERLINYIENLIKEKQKEVLDMVELPKGDYSGDYPDKRRCQAGYFKAYVELEAKKKEILTKLDE